MKITVNAGASIEDVIKAMEDFFKDNYSEYPITKNKTSLYITLKNTKGQICPDNEKEFIVESNGSVTDIFQKEKEEALKNIMSKWYGYYEAYKKSIERIKHIIQTDVNYLETAQELNRKQVNIDKRKKQYEEHLRQLEKEKEYFKKIEHLDELVRNKKITIYYSKYYSRSPYNYRLEVALVFNSTDEYKAYFDGRGLHSGLPNGFID